MMEPLPQTHAAPPLDEEKTWEFREFIWREMGRLGGTQAHDLLDPNSELGRAARRYYSGLRDGQSADQMINFEAPLGSNLLPDPPAPPDGAGALHPPSDPPYDPD